MSSYVKQALPQVEHTPSLDGPNNVHVYMYLEEKLDKLFWKSVYVDCHRWAAWGGKYLYPTRASGRIAVSGCVWDVSV